MDIKQTLGDRIKHYREQKGLSQVALASAIKVDKSAVWRWESGRSWPEYDKLEAIAKHLEIRPEQLFETIGKEPPKQPPSYEVMATLIQDLEKMLPKDPQFRSMLLRAADDDWDFLRDLLDTRLRTKARVSLRKPVSKRSNKSSSK